jgi:hypothetical protein
MNLDRHRRRHDRIVTTASAAVCGLGFAGAISPTIEHTVTVAVIALAGLGVLVLASRGIVRRARERREDHADTLTAITWRAEHLPAEHPLVVRDRLDHDGLDRDWRDRGELDRDRLDRATRLGVA